MIPCLELHQEFSLLDVCYFCCHCPAHQSRTGSGQRHHSIRKECCRASTKSHLETTVTYQKEKAPLYRVIYSSVWFTIWRNRIWMKFNLLLLNIMPLLRQFGSYSQRATEVFLFWTPKKEADLSISFSKDGLKGFWSMFCRSMNCFTVL